MRLYHLTSAQSHWSTMGFGVPPDLVSEPMRTLPGREPGLGIYCYFLPGGLEDRSGSD